MSQFVKEELNHQLDHLFKEVQQADNFLNAEQSVVYKNENWSVENNFGKTYRTNACSSTGKSKEIHSKVRSMNKIALAAALSGIASTLPRSGWTLHSRSKVPLDIREYFANNGKKRHTRLAWRHRQNYFSWAFRPFCKSETVWYRCASYDSRALWSSQPMLCFHGSKWSSINFLKEISKTI